MKTAMDAIAATAFSRRRRPFSATDLDDKGALGTFRLFRATDTSDQLRLASHRGDRHAVAVADEAREPATPRVLMASLGSDPWVPAAYAGEQPWTRDPRRSRVQGFSPRIPHDKVTKWQSIFIRPCQGAIIG
jgi:hypothetical protein